MRSFTATVNLKLALKEPLHFKERKLVYFII